MKGHSLAVVIPCYNIIKNHTYLNELLNVLILQKKSIFYIKEIILINDSPEYNLEDYILDINRTEKLKIINNKVNSGQAVSRNVGLRSITSEYVHFIDQDDLINDSFYYNIKELNDVIIANCFLFNEFKSCKHSRLIKDILLSRFHRIKSLSFLLIFDNIVLSPGQVIFKARNLININGFPELFNYGSDDYALMFNLSNTNFKYSYSINSFFYHRLHEVQGKRFLNMNSSKLEFLNNHARGNNLFILLCKIDFLFFSYLKKALYLMFYRRL